ncbi:MAG: stage V sporulation protein AE [Clostridia bacterium]|nr:stage V sporulation protein AE [Clostridia bacterium]
MDYLWAFLVGGAICAIGQILIDRTSLTPARILTGYVCAGVILSAIGVYDYIVDFAGAGATVPLTGFGHNLFKGVKTGIEEDGFFGLFTGPIGAAAGGLGAAIIFGLAAALISKPKMIN